jgi:hypothetical protein
VSRDGGWDEAMHGVVDIRPKLKFANPFFCLKISRFKAAKLVI